MYESTYQTLNGTASSMAPLVGPCMTVPSDRADVHDGFPGLVLTPSRRLIAAFRRGATHTSYDGDIMLQLSDDRGLTWSEPRRAVAGYRGQDLRDPSLACLSDGRLMMTYFSRIKRAGEVHLRTFTVCSEDDGLTWRDPSVVADLACSAPPVELPGGDLVQPLYRDSVTYLHGSADGGRTWEPRSLLLAGDASYSEPWVVRTDDAGTLVALVRNDTDHQTMRLVSRDGGRTWSEPRPVFPSSSCVSWLKGSSGRSFGFHRVSGNSRLLAVRASEDDFARWTDATHVHAALEGGRNAYAAPVEIEPGVYAVVISQEDRRSRARLHLAYVTEGPAATPLGTTSA